MNEKLIQKIVAPYVVKKLPDGRRGKIVASIKKDAANEVLSFFTL